MKACFVCLIYISLFFSGYALSDSVTDVNIATQQRQNPESKISLTEREPVYKINYAVGIPIIAVGTGFSLYAFTIIYDKDPSTVEQINNLKVGDINSFDQWAVNPYSTKLSDISAYEFYGAMPLPLVAFLLSKDTRHDFWNLTFLYWEAFSITGLFGAGAPYFIDRHRPYTYTVETPMEKRLAPIGKNSAFSGHTEIVATSVFFTAKVYSDYYPEKRVMMFSLATVATGAMAYLRVKGGEHFPSDVLIGGAIGTLSGILVPHFHKHKLIKNPNISIVPFGNLDTRGFTFRYKLK